jgi:hypothetical protein
MASSIEIIKRIDADTADLQKELLSLPGDDGADDAQSAAIAGALESLSQWRAGHVAVLKKLFEQKGAKTNRDG